jgi:hypothetical protein
MLSMNERKTMKVFVAGPGFDLEATIRIACDFNAILVTVKPGDFLTQVLLENLRSKQ